MSRRTPWLRVCLVLGLLFTIHAVAADTERRPIRPADYGVWESLGRGVLSPDGRWLAYTIRRMNGESELRLRMLATDSTETFAEGANPTFSNDSRWLAYSIGVSEAEREKLRKSKKPVRSKLGLHDLTTGKKSEVENVASFTFSEDGRFLLMRHYPAEGRKSGGRDVVVRDLATGRDTGFGNVGADRWHDELPILALAIHAEEEAGNGVQVYDAAKSTLRTLDSAKAKYAGLTWREDADDLAVMRQMEHEEGEDVSHVILTWRGLAGKIPRARVFEHLEREDFPQEMRVTEYAGLRWSDDGKAVFFGIQAWDRKPEALVKKAAEGEEEAERDPGAEAESRPAGDGQQSGDEGGDLPQQPGGGKEKEGKGKKKDEPKPLRETLKDPAGVDVWHARDIDIIPLQKKRVNAEKRRSDLSVWWIESDRFVRLGNELTESVSLLETQKHAIGTDNTPYETEKRFGPTLVDVYLIDTSTGGRQKIVEKNKYRYGSSPDGRWYLYLRDGHFWIYDVNTNQHRNLTSKIPRNFVNQEISSLTDEKPPYGTGGWSEDGQFLLLYDRFDIWMLRSDGSEVWGLTGGGADQVRHRRVILDREDDEHFDPQGAMWVSLYGEWTKKSGYGRLVPGEAIERKAWAEASLGRLTKAKEADVYAWVHQTFADSPDYFVAGAELAEARQVTATNPQQKDYLWGRSELVDYENANGEKLQGALFYPAGYEAGKRYPMIVNIYERVSRSLHRYSVPSERSAYNAAVFSAEGYFVFMPDIVYRPQNPGLSCVDCVVPAVKKVLETGMIDPDRVGITGHSWGGYQTAFLVTQTDVFAAGAAGAPLTNMMSMSMSIYWNSGQTDAWIFHESQGRMDRPFWRDIETYVKNSPIFNIDDLDTPLLVTFGDQDGAVDWHQGIEMYNAARLAQRPLVMLVYEGENHGLARKPNQVDYHYRILEWFGHYLKGEEPKKWITDGIPFLERQKELEAKKREKKGAPASR